MEYDQEAVDLLVKIERAIERMNHSRQGEMLAVVNAIETHVEEGDGDPNVVARLGQALLELAQSRGLTPAQAHTIERKLGDLVALLRSRVASGR